MRKIREVLRLALGAGLELRKIERSLSISHATAASYIAKAKAAGLSWPLPDSLDDGALERIFFRKPAASADGCRAIPCRQAGPSFPRPAGAGRCRQRRPAGVAAALSIK